MRHGYRAALLVALTLLACSDDTGPNENAAGLRLVNGTRHTTDVDLVVDGRTLASGVAFGEASNIVELAPGGHDVRIRTGAGDLVPASTGTFEAGRLYTLFAADGDDETVDPIVTIDTARVPHEGKVKIRVAHLAPQARPLDVYLTEADESLDGATRLIEPFEYTTGLDDEFPGYVERDPGSWRVRFTADDTKDVLVDTGPLDLEAGEVVSVMLVPGGVDSLNTLGVAVYYEGVVAPEDSTGTDGEGGDGGGGDTLLTVQRR